MYRQVIVNSIFRYPYVRRHINSGGTPSILFEAASPRKLGLFLERSFSGAIREDGLPGLLTFVSTSLWLRTHPLDEQRSYPPNISSPNISKYLLSIELRPDSSGLMVLLPILESVSLGPTSYESTPYLLLLNLLLPTPVTPGNPLVTEPRPTSSTTGLSPPPSPYLHSWGAITTWPDQWVTRYPHLVDLRTLVETPKVVPTDQVFVVLTNHSDFRLKTTPMII